MTTSGSVRKIRANNHSENTHKYLLISTNIYSVMKRSFHAIFLLIYFGWQTRHRPKICHCLQRACICTPRQKPRWRPVSVIFRAATSYLVKVDRLIFMTGVRDFTHHKQRDIAKGHNAFIIYGHPDGRLVDSDFEVFA